MLQLQIKNLEEKSEYGVLTAIVPDHPQIVFDSFANLIVPEELEKYVSDLGLEKEKYGPMISKYRLGGHSAFTKLRIDSYYLITKEELISLCQKAFSDKIAERIFSEATNQGG